MVRAMTTPETLKPTVGWIPNPDTFGARLALVRQRMGWNIAEAARECGLNGESWRLWEQGRIPSRQAEIAQAISERTGADLYWLAFDPPRRAVTTQYPPLVTAEFKVPAPPPVQRIPMTKLPAAARVVSATIPPPGPRRTAPTGVLA